jgi:hypothetical protein
MLSIYLYIYMPAKEIKIFKKRAIFVRDRE